MTTGDRGMSPEVSWRLDDLARSRDALAERVTAVENEADQIPVLIERITTLGDRVRVMTTALWSVLGGLVLLTISVLMAAGRF